MVRDVVSPWKTFDDTIKILSFLDAKNCSHCADVANFNKFPRGNFLTGLSPASSQSNSDRCPSADEAGYPTRPPGLLHQRHRPR